MTLSYCQACGGPFAADASACPACGWAARAQMSEPIDEVELWPDDEELALKVELATAGEFEVQGLIGRGGMGTVFLAREIALDRPVAIKVMSPHVMRTYGMAERFKREARLAAALTHPNIIPIHAVREHGPLVCLVMKRLTGRSLDVILREHNALPLPVAQLIIRDVAAGLDFAHQRGVIHRDVKPANILVDEAGAVVVTDFGIAKAREAEVLTASGSAVGTPAYMSPEQAMGKRAEPASDQYSLGVVAYELLTGRMPFESETAMGLMYQHTHTPPGPLREIRPDLPVEVAVAVERMLAKSPADRFPTLAEASRGVGTPSTAGELDDPFRRELARFAGGGPLPTRRASSPSGMARRASGRPSTWGTDPNATTLPWFDGGARRRRRWAVLGLGLMAIGASVLLVRELFRPRSGPVPIPPAVVAAPGPTDASGPRATPLTPRGTAAQPPGATNRPVTIPGAIERYRKAVESRDIVQILAAYPAMEPAQVASYREFFRTATRIRFEVVIKDLEQQRGEARMKLDGFLRFHDTRNGEDKITTYGTRARLVDGPTGWRILEIK